MISIQNKTFQNKALPETAPPPGAQLTQTQGHAVHPTGALATPLAAPLNRTLAGTRMRARIGALLFFLFTSPSTRPPRSQNLLWFLLLTLIPVYSLILARGSLTPAVPASAGVPFVICCMIAAGIAYMGVPGLIAAAQGRRRPLILLLILISGLAARLITFGGDTFFEDDYYRYLWDGGVLANAMSPWGYAPLEVLEPELVVTEKTGRLIALSAQAGGIIENINYPFLSTVYPAVAQLGFTAAHLIKPFDLNAWRLVLLAGDVANFLLILALLKAVGRSRLWVAVYWINPLVIGEFFNSAHVDVLIFPFLLCGLLLIVRGWGACALTLLALATAVKIWPVLLLPLFLRPYLFKRLRKGIALGGLYAVLVAVLFLPMISEFLWGRAGSPSGLNAYAAGWTMNETFYRVVYAGVQPFVGLFSDADIGWTTQVTHKAARVLIASFIAVLALLAAFPKWQSADQLIGRVLLVVAALFLLSPTQFPWYYLWLMPFLAIRPNTALMILTVTMPLYYTRYIFEAMTRVRFYDDVFVWLIVLPMLILFLRDGLGRVSLFGFKNKRAGETL